MRAPMQRHEGGYYVRLTVVDRPGAMAKIATRMGDHQISLESILQKGRGPRGVAAAAVPVILITHATTEQAIRSALDAVQGDGIVTEPPQLIRIER
jgi:homoserine dehydrogenase